MENLQNTYKTDDDDINTLEKHDFYTTLTELVVNKGKLYDDKLVKQLSLDKAQQEMSDNHALMASFVKSCEQGNFFLDNLKSEVNSNFFLSKYVEDRFEHKDLCSFIDEVKRLKPFSLSKTRVASKSERKKHEKICEKIKKTIRHDEEMKMMIDHYMTVVCKVLDMDEVKFNQEEEKLNKLAEKLDTYLEIKLKEQKENGIEDGSNSFKVIKDLTKTAGILVKMKKGNLDEIQIEKGKAQNEIEKDFNEIVGGDFKSTGDKKKDSLKHMEMHIENTRNQFTDETKQMLDKWDSNTENTENTDVKEKGFKVKALELTNKINKILLKVGNIGKMGLSLGRTIGQGVLILTTLPADVIDYIFIAYLTIEFNSITMLRQSKMAANTFGSSVAAAKSIPYHNYKQFFRDWILYMEGYDSEGNKIANHSNVAMMLVESILDDYVQTLLDYAVYFGNMLSIIPWESGVLANVVMLIANGILLFSKLSYRLFFRMMFELFLILYKFVDWVSEKMGIAFSRYLLDYNFMREKMMDALKIVEKVVYDSEGNPKKGLEFLVTMYETIKNAGFDVLQKGAEMIMSFGMNIVLTPLLVLDKPYLKKKFKDEPLIQKIYADVSDDDNLFKNSSSLLMKGVGGIVNLIESTADAKIEKSMAKTKKITPKK